MVFDRKRDIVYQGRINDLYRAPGDAQLTATTHELEDALDALVHGKHVATPRTNAVGCAISDLKS